LRRHGFGRRFKPASINCCIASDTETSFVLAQASIAARNGRGGRNAMMGLIPVGGGPRFLWQGARDAGAARSGLNGRLRMNHVDAQLLDPVPGEWCWSHEGEVRLGDHVSGAVWRWSSSNEITFPWNTAGNLVVPN
jgi:hypothetical protein